MAQINPGNITKVTKEKNVIHIPVAATYSVFEENGERYFQIDTYGQSDRENPGKLSQTIQINKECAKYIVKLLIKEFELL